MLRVWGSGFMEQMSECGVQGLGCGVEGLGFVEEASGFRG